MKIFKFSLVFILLASSYSIQADILWVGDSPACTGGNVFPTYNSAEAVAALNGTASDEIRLTSTIDYTGGLGAIQVGDEIGSTQITVAGGYADCFSGQSGRTFVGSSTTSSFTIDFSTQNSTIILKDLILAFNDSRGVVARGNVFVQLDNVDINNNGFSGLDVGRGATVEVLAYSLIRFNENINNPMGGGVRCTEANSSVIIHGKLEKNRAQKGGNLFVSTGCYAELKDGMRIIGGAHSGGGEALEGGGVYVDNGGELFADGRANRVIIDNNSTTRGGGLFVNGTGFVVLQNTHFNNNSADQGAAIFAQDGGTATLQLIMDQTTDCNLLFRCSEIQNSQYMRSVIEVQNSMIQLQRTVIELSNYIAPTTVATGLITTNAGSDVRLNRVGMIRNVGNAMLRSDHNNDAFLVSHLTVADNNIPNSNTGSYLTVMLAGLLNIQNSLITNSSGIDNRTGGIADISGKCNLIDNDHDWPSGIYHIGTPQLINPSSGDARQLAGSPGVDMCLRDSFAWSSEIDIESQAAPVNENTNPQGLPGDSGGLYDAGFDEVYDNIGPDEFLLTVQKEGSGEGVVISNPSGISCGSDCSEVYFNGTIVTLYANPITGSEFIGWLNCPLVNQDDECLTSVESSHTIRAVFEPDDLIFRDGFE